MRCIPALICGMDPLSNYVGIFLVQLDSMAPHYRLLSALGSEGFPTRGFGILGSLGE